MVSCNTVSCGRTSASVLAHPNIRQPSLSERGSVALNGNQAVRLARALRALRETKWPEHELTQAKARESPQL